MCVSVKIMTVAVLGAVALGVVGLGSATAADLPYSPPQVQAPPDYYASPPREERYAYPPPEVYAYPPQGYGYPLPPVVYPYPPPPPVSYYDYAPVPAVIVPRPYYWSGRPMRGDGPYIARGYERFDRPWGHRGR